MFAYTMLIKSSTNSIHDPFPLSGKKDGEVMRIFEKQNSIKKVVFVVSFKPQIRRQLTFHLAGSTDSFPEDVRMFTENTAILRTPSVPWTGRGDAG